MHDLRAAGEYHGGQRNADRQADIAKQAEQRGPIGPQFYWERRKGDDLQGREDKAEPKTLKDGIARERPGVDVRPSSPSSPTGSRRSTGCRPRTSAIAGPPGWTAGPHVIAGMVPAPRGASTSPVSTTGVLQHLQIRRQQRRRRQDQHADRKHHAQAGGEVPVAEDRGGMNGFSAVSMWTTNR